jgi:hypothetical protein
MLREDVLQQFYDSEINVITTMLWDGGFDFAFVSYVAWPEIGTPLDHLQSFIDPKPERVTPSPWHSCERSSELAEAIQRGALEKYPESAYARLYARPN